MKEAAIGIVFFALLTGAVIGVGRGSWGELSRAWAWNNQCQCVNH